MKFTRRATHRPTFGTLRERDLNLLWDVYVYRRTLQAMIRATRDGHGGWMGSSRAPSLDASGEILAFVFRYPIDRADLNDDEDLFVSRVADPAEGRWPPNLGSAAVNHCAFSAPFENLSGRWWVPTPDTTSPVCGPCPLGRSGRRFRRFGPHILRGP